ncbi:MULTISPECIES: CD1375 family protein [Brevibacillus]|jgi:hypothetical protein|nr:CD1375 family protein [Brevibacillus borstelensis]MED1745722.1 CD1375 family protein [Brevibacillus borstelensis]MED1883069.1 CD1375 family protein [Brevibacillus borstelensis]MED2008674.1 CD1375 family protein [Brevibacillus borstelensis]GED54915.1 hypothetical protein BBO01nite_41560 [Brevibacillus borstelensis]
MVATYMVKVFAYLIKAGRREIETLPEEYQAPVAELLAAQVEQQ